MMRVAHHTKRFRRDYKKLKRSRGDAIQKIRMVMDQLIDEKVLPLSHRDHALHGNWKGCRDCHIEGDCVLIYELGSDNDGQETITFHATGTHENLFG